MFARVLRKVETEVWRLARMRVEGQLKIQTRVDPALLCSTFSPLRNLWLEGWKEVNPISKGRLRKLAYCLFHQVFSHECSFSFCFKSIHSPP